MLPEKNAKIKQLRWHKNIQVDVATYSLHFLNMCLCTVFLTMWMIDIESASDAASDEDDAEIGFDADFNTGDFVIVAGDKSENKFEFGQVKSNVATDLNGHEWVWMLWYARKNKPGTDEVTDVYYMYKVCSFLVKCTC